MCAQAHRKTCFCITAHSTNKQTSSCCGCITNLFLHGFAEQLVHKWQRHCVYGKSSQQRDVAGQQKVDQPLGQVAEAQEQAKKHAAAHLQAHVQG